MRSFGAESEGAIEVLLPDDIAERLERRVEEGRLLGTGLRDWYRIERIEARTPTSSTAYRSGLERPIGVRLVELSGRSTATPLEDVTLMFEPGQVRYVVRFPRWRRTAVAAGVLLGGMLLLMGAWFARLSPPVGGFMMALALLVQLFLWKNSDTQARVQARLALESILASEAVSEQRVRVATEAQAEAESEAEAEPEAEAEAEPRTEARARGA